MIALIVPFSINRVIGNKGIIPWKIKGEQKRFKEKDFNIQVDERFEGEIPYTYLTYSRRTLPCVKGIQSNS